MISLAVGLLELRNDKWLLLELRPKLVFVDLPRGIVAPRQWRNMLERNDTAVARGIRSAHPKGCQLKERHATDQVQSPYFTPTNAVRDVLP